MNRKIWDIIVAGGGASGIFASLFAKNQNNSILILEKNKILGKKISISGNGRCNFTNKSLSYNNYLTSDKVFLENLFKKFDNNSLITFFEKKGILHTFDRFGRVLPYTNEASTIQKLLIRELQFKKISILTEHKISEIKKSKNLFLINAGGKIFRAKFLILSTGGIATPSHGTTGDGYTFLRQLGHTITPIVPSIVPIILEKNPFFKIQGVKIMAEITIKYENSISFSEKGEILFTKYGISGPVSLDISVPVSNFGIKKSISYISLLPETMGFSDKFMIDRFSNLGKTCKYNEFFYGIFPLKFIDLFLSKIFYDLNIDKNLTPFNVGVEKYKKLVNLLKKFPVKIRSLKEKEFARTNSGGIPIEEITQNCESKIINNLFVTGELLDITGYSGGYNLQLAFSTGAVAGKYIKTIQNL